MKIIKTISVVLAVALTSLSAHSSLAQDFDKGLTAYASGDFAAALKEWRPLAEQGGAGAQNNLGWMYGNGDGVPQDYAQAAEWYPLTCFRSKCWRTSISASPLNFGWHGAVCFRAFSNLCCTVHIST
ncbi:MAG: hypothetical protein ACI9UN_004924 [Granulosicoccus sp.]|jgi:hypothetical protein